MGPRPRPDGRARRRHRHRRVGDPVRARRSSRDVERAAPLPAHAAVGHAAHRPPAHDASSTSLFRRLPFAPAPRARGHLLGARVAGDRHASSEPRLLKRPAELLAQALPAPVRSRTRSCARKLDAGLHDRLQAHPASPTTTCPRSTGPTSTLITRRHRARCAATSSSAPTAASARSTRSSSAPAST